MKLKFGLRHSDRHGCQERLRTGKGRELGEGGIMSDSSKKAGWLDEQVFHFL
jgi:hypothetical protein